MPLKGRLVRNQHTVRMSLIIPTFYDSSECDAEYCLTTTEAAHLSASYTVLGSSAQSRSIPFHIVITDSAHKSFSNALALNKHYSVLQKMAKACNTSKILTHVQN
jgi:hypothetical protein